MIANDFESSAVVEGLLNSYEGLHPEIVLGSIQLSREEALSSLRNGDVDALILWTPLFDSTLFSTPIGQDVLVMATNAQNDVSSLTESQVREMLGGQLGNWVDITGAAIPITVIGLPPRSSLNTALQQLVLTKSLITPGADLASDPSDALNQIRTSRGAFSYLPRSLIDESIRQIAMDGVAPTLENTRSRRYKYLVPVVFVSRDVPSGVSREFLDWILSSAGQSIVRRYMLGFSD